MVFGKPESWFFFFSVCASRSSLNSESITPIGFASVLCQKLIYIEKHIGNCSGKRYINIHVNQNAIILIWVYTRLCYFEIVGIYSYWIMASLLIVSQGLFILPLNVIESVFHCNWSKSKIINNIYFTFKTMYKHNQISYLVILFFQVGSHVLENYWLFYVVFGLCYLLLTIVLPPPQQLVGFLNTQLQESKLFQLYVVYNFSLKSTILLVITILLTSLASSPGFTSVLTKRNTKIDQSCTFLSSCL